MALSFRNGSVVVARFTGNQWNEAWSAPAVFWSDGGRLYASGEDGLDGELVAEAEGVREHFEKFGRLPQDPAVNAVKFPPMTRDEAAGWLQRAVEEAAFKRLCGR